MQSDNAAGIGLVAAVVRRMAAAPQLAPDNNSAKVEKGR